MNFYETTFICVPEIEEIKLSELIEKVSSIIKQNNGEIVSVQQWGKKKLAYPIKHKKEGVYVHIEFKSDTAKFISNIEQILRVNEMVIRFLTIKDNKRLKHLIMEKKIQEEAKKEETKEGEIKEVETKEEAKEEVKKDDETATS